MQGIGRISTIESPTKAYVCPNCFNCGCGDYIIDNTCPFCHYPLFSNDFIYMPDFRDAYDLAVLRSMKYRAKKLGFDEDDGSGSI